MSTNTETYISVDVETAGPYPGSYSLLAIGACLVSDPNNYFYVEIQPVNAEATAEALEISQLNMVELQEKGIKPQEAMSGFADWLREVTGEGSPPIFVAFNAPFDWMFISDYFYRYLGHNPFGHKALDIKAYYMGMTGASWSETGFWNLAGRYLSKKILKHLRLPTELTTPCPSGCPRPG